MNRLGEGTVDEASQTTRELITGAGEVLDHYFLTRIVEAAPSPTAADHYICHDLGWSTGDARAVRAAVRLREKEKDKPEHWKQLKQTAFRPAEMFGFKDAPFSSPESKMMVAESLDFIKLRVPYKDWPWLLLELASKDEKGGVTTVATTFDFTGRSVPEKIESLDRVRHPNFYAFFGASQHEYDLGNDYGRLTIFSDGGSRLIKDRLSIYSRSCELTPVPGRVFPRFYKIVEISQPLPGMATERVLIFIRQEIAKRLKEGSNYLPEYNLGEVIYEKDIPVSFELGRAVARLSVAYRINFDLTCDQIPAKFRPAPLSIQYCFPGSCSGNNTWKKSPGQPHEDFRPEKISKAMGELAELAGCFFGREGQESFPLERIVGDNLLISPPDLLASRFVL